MAATATFASSGRTHGCDQFHVRLPSAGRFVRRSTGSQYLRRRVGALTFVVALVVSVGSVAQHGLALPAGWTMRCPGSAIVSGAPRWGVACWNCEGNNANYIAVDIARIGASDAALRYVIAHETCHAIDYMTLGISTELGADLCAALHGAPRP